ncbi:NRDE protein-domain-containing protein [Mycena vitilis]|nr:NRDE protein-domain-containing protein [Mycena vitilis]
MCVAFWTLDHPDYALILCANRDEFLERPALAAAFHDFDTHNPDSQTEARVLSGRDTQTNGTWLGITPATGRVALLTNITEPYQTLPSSRGGLAPTFLLAAPHAPLDSLYPPESRYAGFNMLLLESENDSVPSSSASPSSMASSRIHFPHAFILSNNGTGGRITSRALRPEERANGGLSNGLHIGSTGGETWPKVVQGRALLLETVKTHDASLRCSPVTDDESDAKLAGRLFALLRTTAAEPVRAREELRNTICVKPLQIPGKAVAAAHANGAMTAAAAPEMMNYGTRTATVLLVRRSGAALFVERDVWRHNPDSAAKWRKGE